jgi:glucokinase
MYIGVEIGGTKLQLGVGLGDGVLRGLWRESVDVKAGPEGIRRQITRGIPELLEKAAIPRSRITGIGIGFGGPIDDSAHTVIKSHQIQGWDNFPLAAWMSEITGFPAVLGNDSDVAGLAEALFGAGKGLNPIFYMNIGSGIGGALITDGQIYRGCGRGAAEVGHLRVTPTFWYLPADGFTTYPTADGEIDLAMAGRLVQMRQFQLPLEEVASGWSIARLAQSAMTAGVDPESKLVKLVGGRLKQITCAHVAEAAKQQDDFATNLLDQAWTCVAETLCHVITLLCPRRIVLGGGVSLIGEDLLFQPLRTLIADRVFAPFADCYDIMPAALGEEVVVHGALALVQGKITRSGP